MIKQSNIAVVLLNWNGEQDSFLCLKHLLAQTLKADIIAVDNNSSDNFVTNLKSRYPEIDLIENTSNLGFAGGENSGIRHAIRKGYKYVALINNDAVPEKNWLENLVNTAKTTEAGIVTGKVLRVNGAIDSTGDIYTSWGLAFPRGRDNEDTGQYEKTEEVFGATGGASLYSTHMLKDIGLFDEDFFAYYEDVDLSFRAQLAGYKVFYEPRAIAHHKVGASSSKVSGLTTYMTVKNLPWLLLKNVPFSLLPMVLPRFLIAYTSIVVSSLAKGNFAPTIKGLLVSMLLTPKKLTERWKIQKNKAASSDRIMDMILEDLPPNAHKLRKLRSFLK